MFPSYDLSNSSLTQAEPFFSGIISIGLGLPGTSRYRGGREFTGIINVTIENSFYYYLLGQSRWCIISYEMVFYGHETIYYILLFLLFKIVCNSLSRVSDSRVLTLVQCTIFFKLPGSTDYIIYLVLP